MTNLVEKIWKGVQQSPKRFYEWLPRHWKITLSISIAVLLMIIVFRDAYIRWGSNWTWAAWGEEKSFGGKTIWNWLELLVIPSVLAIAALIFNRQERQNELRIAEERRKSDLEIAENRNQDAVLQNYLDKMSDLILENKLTAVKGVRDKALRENPESDESELEALLSSEMIAVRDMAQVRTVTALRQLNRERRNIVLQFLRDADIGSFVLVGSSLSGVDLYNASLFSLNLHGVSLREANIQEANQGVVNLDIVDLSKADLTKANLSRATFIGSTLSMANLHEAVMVEAILIGANLNRAGLWSANLARVNLLGAKLINADLSLADLHQAILKDADLSRAILRGANLVRANLSGAILVQADLTNADLEGADLSGADLSGANLDMAHTRNIIIRNTTMPDGVKYGVVDRTIENEEQAK